MPNANRARNAGTDLTGMYFGIEIEAKSVSRVRAAAAIKEALGGTVRNAGDYMGRVHVATPTGTWTLVRDGSINCSYGGCEVVSPKLKYEQLDLVQKVVRAMKAAGAKVDRSCGIHVHVDATNLTAKALKNLAKTTYANEAILYKALGVLSNRQSGYARPVSERFMTIVKRMRGASMRQLKNAWYGTSSERDADRQARSHYHSGTGSRYHALNFHSVFYHGTVEFRYFNGSLHAGKVKSYVQLCLALVKKAANSNSAGSRKKEYNTETAKYDFRTFLLALGLKGEEYKTARLHLLKRLPGDAAFRGGRPARGA